MNDRIVYAHLRASGPRAGSIFYVGQGAPRRRHASSFHKTQAWIDTVAECGVVGIVLAEGLTSDEARALEAQVTLALRPWLTNKHPGGTTGHKKPGLKSPMLGYKHTPEAIAKMTEYQRTNHPMKGRKHSEETIAKMRMKNSGENHPSFGKKTSEETKKKISEKVKAAWAKR